MSTIDAALANRLMIQLAKVDSAHQALNSARSAVTQCWGEDPARLEVLHQAVLRASTDGEKERTALVDVVRKALYGSGVSLDVEESAVYTKT